MIEYIIPKYNGYEWVYNIRTAENLKEAKRYILETVGVIAFNWRPCDCEPSEKWQYCNLESEKQNIKYSAQKTFQRKKEI